MPVASKFSQPLVGNGTVLKNIPVGRETSRKGGKSLIGQFIIPTKILPKFVHCGTWTATCCEQLRPSVISSPRSGSDGGWNNPRPPGVVSSQCFRAGVGHESGPIRKKVMSRTVQNELDLDPERLGVAVLIKVDQIAELSGNNPQER